MAIGEPIDKSGGWAKVKVIGKRMGQIKGKAGGKTKGKTIGKLKPRHQASPT